MAKKGNLEKFASREKEERPIRFKKYQYLFLIVCEDQKTEPDYFGRFKSKIPEDTIFLKPVGTGRDPKGVVKRAIEERELLAKESRKEVDAVWVVFDKDDADENATKIRNFNDALSIANQEQMDVAYSNEAFELWLLLHMCDVEKDIPLPRQKIYELLQTEIQKIEKYKTYLYDHSNPDPKTLDIIEEVGNSTEAIARAQILMEHHKNNHPLHANPSTLVHLLMQDLNAWIEYYSFDPKR